MFSKNTTWAIGGGILFAILLSLLGWFLFIRGQNNDLTRASAGRGFGTNIPIFDNANGGSTNQNIRDALLSGFGIFSRDSNEPDAEIENALPRLWNPSSVPVAGITLIGTSTDAKIQFVERPSGNIFEAYLKDGDVTRISNTLVPNVYRAFWGKDTRLVLQHLDENGEIATLIGSIEKMSTSTEESVGEFSGSYLEPDIVSVATSRERNDIFYIVKTIHGSVGIQINPENATQKRIFTSHVFGWRSVVVNGGTILLFQNPSQGIEGNAFLLKNNGDKTILKNNVRGLIASISRNEAHTLYNEIVQGRISLFSKIEDAPERQLSLTTLAEKCVFNPKNTSVVYCAVPRAIPEAQIPDAWYRGEIHFSDDWWIIDTENGTVEQLLSPESDYGITLDVVDPYINEEGTHIVFIDAKTRTPWVLRVVQ